jgi:hypothetical protein
MSKKNKPPKFHHYVPKTYLKHWLDGSGKIYIYDKKTGNIRPSSINGQYFGKNNLNTITYPDDTKGYWVEKSYSEIEGIMSPVLNKVASSVLANSGDVTYEDKLMMSLFVSIQFWRLPVNDAYIDSQIDSGDLMSLGLSAINTETGEKVSSEVARPFYEHISSTDLFRKAYPALRALLDVARDGKYDSLKDWSFYYQSPGFNLTSDNPILYFKKPSQNSIFDNFILPLSPGVLLIAKENPPDSLDSGMSTDLNILQMCHANQFVAGADEAYLRVIANEYEQKFKSIPLHDIEEHIYKKFFQATEK